ncbi:MAG: OmpA family protein [Alphaproteobacteria bacterium]|nr:OmpA family protein [Alphaproteobacteria bacterium]
MFTKIMGGAKPILATIAMLGLAACGGMQLDAARGLSADGAYNKGLYSGYLTLSEMEFHEGDYHDSDVFAGRAMAVAGGKSGGPEALDARPIPAVHKGALAEARRRLVAAIDAGAIDKVPESSAWGVTMFDCWMQEAEENFQPADIAWCRERFQLALAEMEKAVAEAPKPKAAAPAPAAPAVTFVNFTVYFDFDSAAISPATLSTLIDAANAADDMGARTVDVSGYADRAGSAAYNKALSQRRADAVAAELKSLSTLGKMTLQAFGESNNKVVTPDGVKEAKNRRVKIEIRK